MEEVICEEFYFLNISALRRQNNLILVPTPHNTQYILGVGTRIKLFRDLYVKILKNNVYFGLFLQIKGVKHTKC